MSKSRRTRQIVPADGWFAKFKDPKRQFLPLACWPLVTSEDDEDGIVMGMIADECLHMVEDEDDFEAYYHVSEIKKK